MADTVTCSEPGCTRSIPDHRWGRTKNDDWFQQRDGRVWCPDHHPAWVEGWRTRMRETAAALELPEGDAAPCLRCFTVPAKNGTCSC